MQSYRVAQAQRSNSGALKGRGCDWCAGIPCAAGAAAASDAPASHAAAPQAAHPAPPAPRAQLHASGATALRAAIARAHSSPRISPQPRARKVMGRPSAG